MNSAGVFVRGLLDGSRELTTKMIYQSRTTPDRQSMAILDLKAPIIHELKHSSGCNFLNSACKSATKWMLRLLAGSC